MRCCHGTDPGSDRPAAKNTGKGTAAWHRMGTHLIPSPVGMADSPVDLATEADTSGSDRSRRLKTVTSAESNPTLGGAPGTLARQLAERKQG